MAQRLKPPRLYLDPKRRTWSIRDGGVTYRTGLDESQRSEAEQALARHLAKKHTPQPSSAPLIADVMLVYLDERVAHTKSLRSNKHAVKNIALWWGDKRVSDITPDKCREYIASKGRSVHAARHDLESLRAALHYWHKSAYGPLDRIPAILMPPRPEPRERWLTDEEFARLHEASKRVPHLERFVLIGWHTGTRPGAIMELEWSWIDLAAGVMRRRAPGKAEDARKRRPPVRLGKTILAHMKRWHAEDGPARRYVVHWDGRKIASIHYSWENAVAEAGLDEKVTPHTLRHSRATRLMQAGVPIWEAAGHLGMSVETLTRVYLHHSPDWQKTAAEV
jgi:integrase